MTNDEIHEGARLISQVILSAMREEISRPADNESGSGDVLQRWAIRAGDAYCEGVKNLHEKAI